MNKELETFEALCWAKVHGELPAARETEFTTGLATIPGAAACFAGVEALHNHLLAAATVNNSEAGEDALVDALLGQIEADPQTNVAARTGGIHRGVIPFRPAESGERGLPMIGNPEETDCQPLAFASGDASTSTDSVTIEEHAAEPRTPWLLKPQGLLGVAVLAAAMLMMLVSVVPDKTRGLLDTPTVQYFGMKAPDATSAAKRTPMDPAIQSVCQEFRGLLFEKVDPDPDCVFYQISGNSARIYVTVRDETISHPFNITSDIPDEVETLAEKLRHK